MQSLLTTMGILLARYDEGKDYLANFEPFVVDRLSSWPPDEPVGAKRLAQEMTRAFSFPPIPLNTVSELISRVEKDGYLQRRVAGKYHPNPKALRELNGDLLGHRTDVLAHFEALSDALRAYAKERFDLDWSQAQADKALEDYVAEFGIEMMEARQAGGFGQGSALPDRSTLGVIHGFARHCLTRDAETFGYLEELVKGSMLTNVLYYKNLGDWSLRLDNLIVFLDTPIALRVLGLAPEEMRLGAEELMSMLKAMKVPVRVFDHTVTEILGILEGVRSNLEMARRKELDLNSFKNLNREVIEHLMHLGWGPADVQEIASDLEGRLAKADIAIEPVPPITRSLSLSESRLEEMLLNRSFTRSQIAMDIRSVAAVYRLRKGNPARSLARASAVFVTPNRGLVRTTNAFFREQGYQSSVGICLIDRSITTQLWLAGSSEEGKQAPRKMLIAECFAALDPSQVVWKKYLDKIEARRKSGAVTDEQVKTLIFSSVAQESFFDLTRNDPDLISDLTPQQVLDRYEEIVREPAEIEARRAREELGEKREQTATLQQQVQARSRDLMRQHSMLDAQRDRIDELEAWKSSTEVRRRRRRAMLRKVGGASAAVLVLLGTAISLATGVISGSFGFALVVAVAIAIAVLTLGWGFRKPLRWSRDLIYGLGASSAVFFGIYGVAQGFMG